jgi:hypothetical protein
MHISTRHVMTCLLLHATLVTSALITSMGRACVPGRAPISSRVCMQLLGPKSEAVDAEIVGPDMPEYPEGLHEPAKADRRGPFTSSLGEPDVTTGVRTPYLRRDDWHISSTYTPQERSAAEEEEKTWTESVTIEVPAAELEEDCQRGDYDPTANLEFFKTEPGEPASGAQPSKLPMPQSWQEYQFLQAQISEYVDDVSIPPAAREEAAKHVSALDEFYEDFKAILSEGWTLLNNPIIEDAAKFIIQRKKA